MKTIKDITLKDLMTENLYISAVQDKFMHDHYNLQIEDEEGGIVLYEAGLDEDEIDQYAKMCRQFLSIYDRRMWLKFEVE